MLELNARNILDRVGGGDAFASGLIYAMLHDYKAILSASQIDTNLSFFTKYVIKSLDSTSQNMLSFVNILEKI